LLSAHRESGCLYFRGGCDGKKAFDLTLFTE